MISFFRRAVNFAKFLVIRSTRLAVLRLRSRTFLWLDINLVISNPASVRFNEAQRVSLGFTRTVLRPDLLWAPLFEPASGIYVVPTSSEASTKLRWSAAIALRLATPRSACLVLSHDHAASHPANSLNSSNLVDDDRDEPKRDQGWTVTLRPDHISSPIERFRKFIIRTLAQNLVSNRQALR